MRAFEQLLRDFEKLPGRKPTFLEITGVAHREVYNTNILAFFFDPEQEHGYDSLFRDSLLACINASYTDTGSIIRVHQEYNTDTSKRIDLVIETERAVFAVENKLWAGLYNDLYDYQSCMSTHFAGKATFCIVLSLEGSHGEEIPVGETAEQHFIRVRHDEFAQQIQQNLEGGSYTVDEEYLPFLNDFIQTTLNQTSMDEALIDFFIDHNDAVRKFLNAHTKVKNARYHRILQIQEQIHQRLSKEMNESMNVWVHNRSNLVFDFNIKGTPVAVDCIFELRGIYADVFFRGTNEADPLEFAHLQVADMEVENKGRRQVTEVMPYRTPDEEIITTIIEVLEAIRLK